MSSYTSTITISDKEWKQIQKCIADTDRYIARQKEKAERLRKEAELRKQELLDMREQLRKTSERAAEVLQGDYKRELEHLSGITEEAIRQQSKEYEGEMNELRQEIKNTRVKTKEAATTLERISNEYTHIIKKRMEQNQETASRAKVYFEHIESQLERIKALNPEQLEAERYQELLQLAESARANLQAGSYEAVLITSQNGIEKAAKLLTELIVERELYDNALTDTMEQANALRERFEILSPEMQGAITVELDGEKIEYEYDIDHWSEGRFSKLKGEFQALDQQLLAIKTKQGSGKELEQLQKSLENISSQLKQCDISARQELLGSLEAQEAAVRLCDSLLDHDWRIEDHGFDKGDDRNPYTLKLKDGNGNQVSVVVAPGASAVKPNIFLEGFDRSGAHSELVKKNVQAGMAEEGIQIEQTSRLDDCSSHSDGDTFIRNSLERAIAVKRQRQQRSFEN